MCHYKNTRENLTEMFKVVDVYNAERLQRVVDCAIVGLELDLTSVTSNQCMSRHCEKLILLVFSVGHVSVGHVLVASLHIRLAVALKKFFNSSCSFNQCSPSDLSLRGSCASTPGFLRV